MVPKVWYVWDENLISQADRLPAVPGRASLVHSLIVAYKLHDHMDVVRSTAASYNDLREFHSELYLDHLKTLHEVDDDDYMTSAQDEECGIGYDCPPVSNMFELVSTIAGGSITGAKCLIHGLADVAINWCGGWHHANRFAAEGFCYVNDIVLAIEKLRKKFGKVLYIDLDVHHGNGVQDAYSLSNSVFTLSLHIYEPGFYPGTGGIHDIGTLGGKGYACNFPFHESFTDSTYEYVFERVFPSVYKRFLPDAVVVQCGADSLARDPHGRAALTARGYGACVRRVLDKGKPTLLLGGGGYNDSNAARLWASLTALAVGVTLDENIPEHAQWPRYGPDYTINIEPALAKDVNKISFLDECIATIDNNLKTYLTDNEIDKEPEAKKPKANSYRKAYKENETNKININNETKTLKTENDVYNFDDE